MSQSNNPHDHFFRASMSKRPMAKSFIQEFLPPSISENLDMRTLKLEHDSFLDEHLQEHLSDVIYSCRWKGFPKEQVYINFLWEHKSFIPQYPHLQLLRYLVTSWEYQNKNKAPLRPIIPIIVYHGNRKWTYKLFHEYFYLPDEELRRFIPTFEYLITDLTGYSDKELKNIRLGMLGGMLMLLKHSKDKKYIQTKTKEILLFAWRYTPSYLFEIFMKLAVVYISKATPVNKTEFDNIIKSLPPKFGNMTAYQEIVQTGIEIGEKKGIQLSKILFCLRIFQKNPGMSNEEIADMTLLEIEMVKKIKKDFPMENEAKYFTIAQKLLDKYPEIPNEDLSKLFKMKSVELMKIRRKMERKK